MARTAAATMESDRKKESQPAARKKETNGKKESFTFFAPSAETVMLVGDFTAWEQKPVSLKKQKDGSWKAVVALDEGEHEYRFLVDGQWQDDAECPNRRPNGYGQQNCIRTVR